MRYVRLFVCLVLAFVLALPFLTTVSKAYGLPAPGHAPPDTSARAMALLDVESGEFLCTKNASERLPMASTTKIMTALVALERLPLDRVVTVSPEATGIEGSSVYLYAGEQITVETLLFALLLSSANDAAVALAIETAGTVADFAALMNEKAAELGLADTHFCNPNGLHDAQHYTTASDLARLTAHALKDAQFARIVATRKHSVPQNGTDASRLFVNHNRLLGSYEGAIGVKTGFTKAAGRCLVSAAMRDGLTLVCVTLACPDDWRDHAALFDFGFSEYVRYTATPPALSLPVVGGACGEVAILPAHSPSFTLPREHEALTCTTVLPRFLFGGFDRGKEVGALIYRLNGVEIGRIPLLTATACAREEPLSLWARIKRIFIK
jgi:D-alanyl-D-alanine carboxypeptidase